MSNPRIQKAERNAKKTSYAATYPLEVFHCIALHLLEVLVAQVDVPLGEDVTRPIVVSVSPQVIS